MWRWSSQILSILSSCALGRDQFLLSPLSKARDPELRELIQPILLATGFFLEQASIYSDAKIFKLILYYIQNQFQMD